MRCPIAGARWHTRRPLADHRRRRRYRRAGGCAPPRLVPLERVQITAWAIGPVPDGWRPRRHWNWNPRPALVWAPAPARASAPQHEPPEPLPEPPAQLSLWEAPTSPVEPPARRGRARGPRAEAAHVGPSQRAPLRGGPTP